MFLLNGGSLHEDVLALRLVALPRRAGVDLFADLALMLMRPFYYHEAGYDK